MFRKPTLIGMVAGLVLMSATVFQTQAALTSYYITFNASGFPEGALWDPVSGSFTVTLDPTQSYTDETSGISWVDVPNFELYSALGFTYPFDPGNGVDYFLVGGVQNGVADLSPNTNDFGLAITNFPTDPTFYAFAYTTLGSFQFYDAQQLTGTVTVVPLPPTVLLLGSGLLGLGLLGWRRKRSGRNQGVKSVDML